MTPKAKAIGVHIIIMLLLLLLPELLSTSSDLLILCTRVQNSALLLILFLQAAPSSQICPLCKLIVQQKKTDAASNFTLRPETTNFPCSCTNNIIKQNLARNWSITTKTTTKRKQSLQKKTQLNKSAVTKKKRWIVRLSISDLFELSWASLSLDCSLLLLLLAFFGESTDKKALDTLTTAAKIILSSNVHQQHYFFFPSRSTTDTNQQFLLLFLLLLLLLLSCTWKQTYEYWQQLTCLWNSCEIHQLGIQQDIAFSTRACNYNNEKRKIAWLACWISHSLRICNSSYKLHDSAQNLLPSN